jgi:hypothetical protein
VVVGFERHLPQLLHRSGADPLVAPTTQSGRRTRTVGDSFISAAENQDLDELVENQPVGHSVTVAAKGMNVRLSFGQQGAELLSDGLDEYGGMAGTGMLLRIGKLKTLPG